MDRREPRVAALDASVQGFPLKAFKSPWTRMIPIRLRIACAAFCLLGAAGTVAAQSAPGSGRLEGVVVRQDGSGVGGVLVLIEETGRSELTDATGKYAFGRLAPATYTVRVIPGSSFS